MDLSNSLHSVPTPPMSSSHILNHRPANKPPKHTPPATWGQVWYPNHTLERTIMLVHGTTTNGANTASGWRLECNGRYMLPNSAETVKKVHAEAWVLGILDSPRTKHARQLGVPGRTYPYVVFRPRTGRCCLMVPLTILADRVHASAPAAK